MKNEDISFAEVVRKSEKKKTALFFSMMACLLLMIPFVLLDRLNHILIAVMLAVNIYFILRVYILSGKKTILSEMQNLQLSTTSSIYISVCDLDVINNTASEIRNLNPAIAKAVQSIDHNMQDVFFGIMRGLPESPTKQSAIDFCDLSTIDERLRDTNVTTLEYISYGNIWVRSRLIVSERTPEGKISHVIWMLENIDKEKKERELLQDMSAKAIAASEAKSSFLSNMSHEIRTPINAVLGMNEMILRECSDENILAYSESIRTAGTTLLGLINDILDFSKIEAGKMDIIDVDYELASVINDLVNMIQGRADSKGLLLELDCNSAAPDLLHGDEIRIKQIVTNILTNAVKYTEKGTVTFSVGYSRIADDPDSVLLCISVKDTGIGIKKEDIPGLFTEFERLDENRNRGIEGTGLGMNITQRLLAMMGSSLNVTSEYGKGSVFSFSIKQRVVKWDPIGDVGSLYKRSNQRSKKYKELFTAPQAHILVVDDNRMNLMVFKSLLKKTCVRIDTAESGDEGISLALENKYDIIFLDHMMPNKNGIETLAELDSLKDNPNKDIPVICLTANAVSGAREQYLAAGFDDYITKPIDPSKLEEMMLRYLPREKVIFPDTAASGEKPDGTESNAPLPQFLYDIEGLDAARGLKNCSSAESYLETLRTFTDMSQGLTDEIEQLCTSGDIPNAVIKIHALKSNLRIIGAEKAGELAQTLETAGKSGDDKTVYENVGTLLSASRSLREKLLCLSEDKNKDLPEISEEELSEVFTMVKEFSSVFDYDSALKMINDLSNYRIPEEKHAVCSALRKAADNFDYDSIPRILDGEV